MRALTRSHGFTLVEVLVALMVFVVGVLSIAAMMPTGSRSVNRSGDQTRASELASACAERLLSTSYADADLFSGAHVDPANPREGKYYVGWSVQDDQPMPLCKRATITVRWPTSTSAPGASLVIVVPRSGG
jgi:prepilin-type N-terminal cleavage/methylation domain-containing protein